jgi:tellurite resistance protein TerC
MNWETIGLWGGFCLFVLILLAFDLGVIHRRAHVVSIREAALWSVFWITLALLFNLGIYFWRGTDIALEFLTGYLIEKSLSVDNLFVFVVIFSAFGVPALLQHRVLFWGILGALVMRGALILLGAVLIKQFHWIIYLFGLFLIITGIRLLVRRENEIAPENNLLVKLARRVLPITAQFEGARFFVRRGGRLTATLLLLVLLVIESTDLVFALDSIPAIFAVTDDPFIIYTSNVFAILGLRALYFVLAGAVAQFHYLKLGLSAVLAFVGAKMMLTDIYKIPTGVSLIVIVLILALAVLASLVRARRNIPTTLPISDTPD